MSKNKMYRLKGSRDLRMNALQGLTGNQWFVEYILFTQSLRRDRALHKVNEVFS